MRAEPNPSPAAPSPSAAGSSAAASAPAAPTPSAAAEQGQGVDIFSVRGARIPILLRVEVFKKVKKMKFKAFAFKGLSLNKISSREKRVIAIPSSSSVGEGLSFSFRKALEEGTILVLILEEKRGGCRTISRMFFMVNLEKKWIMKRDGMLFILENLQLLPSIELFYDRRRELAEEQLKRNYGASATDMFSPELFALWKFFFPHLFS